MSKRNGTQLNFQGASTRRDFLRLSATFGIASFLNSILFERAEASTSIPRRVIFIHSHNGVMPSAWSMSTQGSALNLGGQYTDLQRHASWLNVIAGMRNVHQGNISGHVAGGPTFLTNTRIDPYDQNNGSARAQGESLDHAIARQTATRLGLGPNLRGLLLPLSMGDQWGGGEFITYQGSKSPIRAHRNVDSAFQSAFGLGPAPLAGTGGVPTGMGAPSSAGPGASSTAAASALARQRQRKSVIDFVRKDFDAIRKQLSASERTKMDDHFQAVREIEASIVPPVSRPPVVVTPGATPSAPFQASACPANAAAIFENGGTFRQFARVAVEAMACGQTQVATIRLLGGNGVSNSEHHAWHHGEQTSPEASHNAVTKWQAGEVAWLIDQLLARRESGVPMLENTLVVWCNEIGIGGFQEHGGNNLPLILAGRCGGYFGTGRLVAAQGRSHSQVLVSIARAMGLEVSGWGNMTDCQPGEVTEIKA